MTFPFVAIAAGLLAMTVAGCSPGKEKHEAGGTIAEAARRIAPEAGSRTVHITSGMSASSTEAARMLERLRTALGGALRAELVGRGMVVSRNVAPPVRADGDVEAVLQPEKLEPLPELVIYFALSDRGAPAGHAIVTFWTVDYRSYVAGGVFQRGVKRGTIEVEAR